MSNSVTGSVELSIDLPVVCWQFKATFGRAMNTVCAERVDAPDASPVIVVVVVLRF